MKRIGQLEVIASGDLVAVLHLEPKYSEYNGTYAGTFHPKAHWTQLTPSRARNLASALIEVADVLDKCRAAKAHL